MQKRNITLLLDELVVVINPPLIHLSAAGQPSRRTYQRLGPPRLFEGRRAHHLTIPLEPRRYGPDAGKFDIHLTYLDDSGRRHHETIAMLRPETIECFFRPIGEALLAHYLRVVRRVTVEDLKRDGYFVMLLNEETVAWLDDHLSRRRTTLRLTNRKLAGSVGLYDPEVMNELRDVPECKTMTLVREDDEQALSVGYQPNGLDLERPPGWYAMTVDESIRKVVDAATRTTFPSRFYEAAIVIARELQVDVDVDALEQGMGSVGANSEQGGTQRSASELK